MKKKALLAADRTVCIEDGICQAVLLCLNDCLPTRTPDRLSGPIVQVHFPGFGIGAFREYRRTPVLDATQRVQRKAQEGI